jgi:hypothetical protein
MSTEPPMLPEHPTPCRARAMIKAMLFFAVAAMILPTKNMRMETKYTHLAETYLYSLPQTGAVVLRVRKMAPPYQPT